LAINLGVLILAAGQGKRMRSAKPKVLHHLAGRPLLEHVLMAAESLAPERVVVVYGHGGQQVPETFGQRSVQWVEQAEQRGTGHAVREALPALRPVDRVLILYGDVPLIEPATLRALLAEAGTTPIALLTVELADPAGYGRVERSTRGAVQRIVEDRDAAAAQRKLREVNTGIMVVERPSLERWIGGIEADNAQGEYYLTDIIGRAVAEGVEVQTLVTDDPDAVLGVNDRAQLAYLERIVQRSEAQRLLLAGVSLRDPARFDLRGTLQTGSDVEIDINVVLEGEVFLGDGVHVGANCVIRDSRLEAGASVLENCVIEGAVVGPGSRVGPFARIRPDTRLDSTVRIGNFVEIKKSFVGRGSKINHLSYLGDATVGTGVNIGAGTITCNYDGANKHRTVIGDNAFIGSNTQLVAPVEVGAGATIGAGSVITRDAPDGELTLSRAKQTTIAGWERPVKRTQKD